MERRLALFLLGPFIFFTTATSQEHNVCPRPELAGNIEMSGIQRYFSPGAELALSCKQGFTPISGPRKIVCIISGEWTKTKFMCIPKRCPHPDEPPHGEIYYEDNVYQSIINFTCHEGFTLTGNETAECLADGTWSSPVPECTPVSCGLAPIPQFGMIVYDKKIRGNTTFYGLGGTYKCLPPYALIGDARTRCTASGVWSKTPECRVVTCPPPETIDNGYMLNDDMRRFDFMEMVKYDCHGDYVLHGSHQIVCQQNGNWSEKPSCKAPCRVDIQRGRILYKGKRIWISDLSPNKIKHEEIVSVYCMDKTRACGYEVSTQCIDGKLKIPECFEEPTRTFYSLYPDSLPSEVEQC